MKYRSPVELLEARIAPAVFVTSRAVTYVDSDGDQVRVLSDRPIFHQDLREFEFVAAGSGEQLEALTLGARASGADISIDVITAAGDGHVNVGAVLTPNVHLGSLTIDGDLGRITAHGIGTLSVASLGAQGLSTQDGSGSLQSQIHGNIGKVFVAGDVQVASLVTTGTISHLQVGGSLIGDTSDQTGYLHAARMGSVFIGGDIHGGAGQFAGSVSAAKSIGAIHVGGRLMGGAGDFSGQIGSALLTNVSVAGGIEGGTGAVSGSVSGGTLVRIEIDGGISGSTGFQSGALVGNQLIRAEVHGNLAGGEGGQSGAIRFSRGIGKVDVGGSVLGSDGLFSGEIFSFARMGQVEVHGNVQGDTGGGSGIIHAGGNAGTIAIHGALEGGSGATSGAVTGARISRVEVDGGITGVRTDYPATPSGPATLTGAIAADRIDRLQIGRNIVAANLTGGSPQTSYAIDVAKSVGTLEIDGGIAGNALNRVGMAAGALSLNAEKLPDDHGSGASAGIGRITIGGSVSYAEITAGYAATEGAAAPQNPDAHIGPVTVLGQWMASSLTAGVGPGSDGLFGTADDLTHAAGVGKTRVLSAIAQIKIFGQVTGTGMAGDSFAIEANRIGAISVDGLRLTLPKDSPQILLAPFPGGVLLQELPQS